jgi:hypothetical protein
MLSKVSNIEKPGLKLGNIQVTKKQTGLFILQAIYEKLNTK